MLDRLTPCVKPFSRDILLLNAINEDGHHRLLVEPFPYPAIVVGRGTRIQDEVKLHNVLSDGIPIHQRIGGGCSVFLDTGGLIISVVFQAEGFLNIRKLFKHANAWLIKGLKRSGIKSIYQDGVSDIVINNKKVGGSCFYRARGIAYFSASILVSADGSLMERYLYPPPREPEYRNARSHMDFMTTFDAHYQAMSIHSLADDLKKNLDPVKLRG